MTADALVRGWDEARAVGLPGNDRKAASATERARVNLTRAVKAALDRIAEHDRCSATTCLSTVRTGTFCCYATRTTSHLAALTPKAADHPGTVDTSTPDAP